METSSGFYKKDINEILFSPNGVYSLEYNLVKENKDSYVYPVDGWGWFDSFDEAVVGLANYILNPSLSITMRQARLQLAIMGLYDAVNSAVSSMGQLAQIEWEYAATVEKSNPLTSAMVQLLNWSSEETDLYFSNASKL